ncbi:SMC-Scp complex subunit ScpB [Pararhizobium qamdonense]|uniref:SMC-Scp complex subunit ScpB n=1 Tax=Pararhizobium qamdonense TaxID=3031126 RepID=UPI0023E0B948|nr:SMC-Scp complex subunit ScpB [Pararhizobium qamdonense]
MIGNLRGAGFIGYRPRNPTPGEPYTYVTTPHFPSVFGMNTLRDLPNVGALEDAVLLSRHAVKNEVEAASNEGMRTSVVSDMSFNMVINLGGPAHAPVDFKK